MPHVVWAEESKNGLRFEIRPSYDVVPTRSQLVTHAQSSRRLTQSNSRMLMNTLAGTYALLGSVEIKGGP